jgi:translation initiation factor IF-3
VDDDRHSPESWLRTHSVRVIASDGPDLGVMTRAEALRRASDAGLTLVEVIIGSDPVVCRMMNAEQLDLYSRATDKSAN